MKSVQVAQIQRIPVMDALKAECPPPCRSEVRRARL